MESSFATYYKPIALRVEHRKRVKPGEICPFFTQSEAPAGTSRARAPKAAKSRGKSVGPSRKKKHDSDAEEVTTALPKRKTRKATGQETTYGVHEEVLPLESQHESEGEDVKSLAPRRTRAASIRPLSRSQSKKRNDSDAETATARPARRKTRKVAGGEIVDSVYEEAPPLESQRDSEAEHGQPPVPPQSFPTRTASKKPPSRSQLKNDSDAETAAVRPARRKTRKVAGGETTDSVHEEAPPLEIQREFEGEDLKRIASSQPPRTLTSSTKPAAPFQSRASKAAGEETANDVEDTQPSTQYVSAEEEERPAPAINEIKKPKPKTSEPQILSPRSFLPFETKAHEIAEKGTAYDPPTKSISAEEEGHPAPTINEIKKPNPKTSEPQILSPLSFVPLETKAHEIAGKETVNDPPTQCVSAEEEERPAPAINEIKKPKPKTSEPQILSPLSIAGKETVNDPPTQYMSAEEEHPAPAINQIKKPKPKTPEPQILPPLSRIPFVPLETLTDAELDMTVEEWIRYQVEVEFDKLRRDGERELLQFKVRAEEVRKVIEKL